MNDVQFQAILAVLRDIQEKQEAILDRLSPPFKYGATAPVPKAKTDSGLAERAKLLRCPDCGSDMVLRNRKSDGEPFFGCSSFRDGCRGLLPSTAMPLQEDIEKAERLKTPLRTATRLAGFGHRPTPQNPTHISDALPSGFDPNDKDDDDDAPTFDPPF